jgi:signal transduction histidine kinase
LPIQHGEVALRRSGIAVPLTGPTTARTAQTAVALAIVPVAVSAVWLALSSDHVERPVATALYRSYLAVVPMLIGLYWWRRRPASRFGPVLIAFGVTAWVVSWQSSDWPLAFDLGVLAEAPAVVLTIYLFLGFPTGRLESPADRLVIAGWTIAAVSFFLPWALLTPVIAGGGPLSTCVPACPENVLQLGSAPRAVELLGRWETYAMLALTVVVLVVYALRLRAASRPRRRALIAVAASSLLFLPIFFVYHFSRQILELDPGTLEKMSWFVVGIRVVLPLGFLAALLQADLFAGVARGRLLEELVRRPSPRRWRDAVAGALDDPALRMAYWDPASRRYVQPDGEVLAPPPGPDRAWVEADHDHRPVAAMVIDGALAEDPELVRAATSATTLAVENGNLEGERRRIERDLHDGAQQRLVALRVHLELAGERIDRFDQRVMVKRLGREVDAALEDLRSVAQGVSPDVLHRSGTGAALRAIARDSAVPIAVDDRWSRRHGDEIERTTYYCCLEALQNAAKHGGPSCFATVLLTEEDGRVRFVVEDDGVGFDPAIVARGAGLHSIGERVAEANGTVRIDSVVGRGTRISGVLPTVAGRA